GVSSVPYEFQRPGGPPQRGSMLLLPCATNARRFRGLPCTEPRGEDAPTGGEPSVWPDPASLRQAECRPEFRETIRADSGSPIQAKTRWDARWGRPSTVDGTRQY